MSTTRVDTVTRIISLAWRNVLRNWRHSLATTMAITCGFMAISLFDGFLEELKYRINDGYQFKGMLAHVLVQHEGAEEHFAEDSWLYALTSEEQKFLEEFLKQDPDFAHRVRFLDIAGLVNAGSKSAIFMGFGYDIDEGAKVRGERWAWNTVAGKPLHLAENPGAVIGTGLGHLLNCEATSDEDFLLPDGNYKAEDRPFKCSDRRLILSATTEYAQVNALHVEVTGLLDAGFREVNKRALYMPLPLAQQLLDTDKITMMTILLKDEEAVPAFIDRMNKAAKQQGIALEVTPWQKHRVADYVRRAMDLLSVFRNLFMAIVVIIGVMSVANTMMKSVNERVREIGTFRSLGFLKQHITFMFACEGLFISVIACFLGLIATIISSWLVGLLGIYYRGGVLSMPIQLKVQYAPVAWGWSFVLLTLLAMVTAYLSARRASGMVIADAMRHT